MLLGREAETAQLLRAVEAARGGESSVLVILGEAGIGKTSLLDFVAASAPDAVVLSTCGAEVECNIPYVALADLLRPHVSRLGALPSPQAAAIAGVLAIGPTSGDRFAVAAATLNILGVLASDGALLVIVDDAQWIDAFSIEAFAFAARRLNEDGVVLLFAAREQELPEPLSGFPSLMLHGLDSAAAHELLAKHLRSHASRRTLEAITAEVGGNPLALIELAPLLGSSHPPTWLSGPDPLPVGDLVAQAFSSTIKRLPSRTQTALGVLAVLGLESADVTERVLARRGLSLSDLAPAEDAGVIVETAHGGLGFRHRLLRAAVHQRIPLSHRRLAHRAAVEVLQTTSISNQAERQAWHLLALQEGPNAASATLLRQAAETELLRKNYPAAGHLFERSARLSEPGDERTASLLRAADAMRLAGAVEQARALLHETRNETSDRRLRTGIDYYALRLDMWRGSLLSGRDALVELAETVADSDGGLAALMLADAALASTEAGQLEGAGNEACRAMLLSKAAGNVPLPVELIHSFVMELSGQECLRDVLRRRGPELEDLDPLSSELSDQLLLVAGVAHLAIEDLPKARDLIGRAVSAARDVGAAGVLPFRLGYLATTEYWLGHWNEALTLAHEALQLARDTGWVQQIPKSLVGLAVIEAAMGRETDCRMHAAEAMHATHALPPHQAAAHAALGLLDLSQRRLESAATHITHAARITAEMNLTDTPLLSWSGDLVETFARLGQLGEASSALRRLERGAERSRRHTAAAIVARCRGLIYPECYEGHFATALRLHQRAGTVPFERARTELYLGEQLRRDKRRNDARQWLESSLGNFTRLGAVTWAERAREELRATGLVHLAAEKPLSTLLTPQELQIALAAASGARNRDVAAQLFLSVKTVEFHLGKVYQKLGVKRTQLGGLFERQGIVTGSSLTPSLVPTKDPRS